MQTVNDIRNAFLEYFSGAGHEVVPSSSVVPENDPTLLFTNAGMVQFKNVFTGVETRPYTKAASSQKCIRAGGKHNDLDNVGYTARHHTFFEMLGNFSFGDYFKEEAILLAWNLMTRDMGIPADKLTATVYAEDDEAWDLWAKISGLPAERIIRIPTSDNFWSMGDTGPCGPCSEIFYDHGDHIWGGPPGTPEEDGDRFVEIWNLVFMQYDQSAEGRTDLPKPSIDTGMGLERIAAVMQGTHDNYETDMFKALIAASEDITGVKAQGDHRASHRVIADHLRSCSFMLTDGVTPSNEGRGYVLRRIMRRAMRHANLLGMKEPLMHQLVPALVAQMGDAYGDLKTGQKQIERAFLDEEVRFLRTLDRGMTLLNDEINGLSAGGVLSGAAAFKLYDTYGFPLDLTEDALRSHDLKVDSEGFAACMQAQKEKARAAWKGSGDAASDNAWLGLKNDLPETQFTGYERLEDTGTLLAIVSEGKSVTELKHKGAPVDLVFDRSPFYGESGGQAGDVGRVEFPGDAVVEVFDTQKMDGRHILRGELVNGSLRVGEEARQKVDVVARAQTRRNHSATHLLHAALRRKLGEGVQQKGSYVGPDRLRFDFSHNAALTPVELREVEREVNEVLWQAEDVSVSEMSADAARDLGAMALFGEKYGDVVRVLQMGGKPEARQDVYSIELCGGTHVSNTGDIGLFRIVGESAVAAGIRRIEALTGEPARKSFVEDSERLHETANVLKARPDELAARIEAMQVNARKLEAELSEARRKLAMGGGAASSNAPEDVNGVKFLGRVAEGVPAKDLRGLVDQAKGELGSGVAAFIGVNDGKAGICIGVSSDLTDRISAVDLVREASAALGGKGGGGRPDMAQAGGPDGSRADEAIAAIKAAIAS